MTESPPPQHNHNEQDPAAGTLQGKDVRVRDLEPALREEALNEAFDYRGDVTLFLHDGTRIDGYIFDRRGAGDQAVVRIWPNDSDEKRTIPYADIARLFFSGRDTAAGKSWETWVKKYYEKKARGEEASIYEEPLDDNQH